MDPTANFRLVILQTELERFKFLIRSYLRARISKVGRSRSARVTWLISVLLQLDKFAQFYLKSPDPQLLSQLEQQYLTSHSSLLASYYNAAFLSSFPTALQRLDDASGGVSMVDAPDLDSTVFVRVLRDCGVIDIYGQEATSEVELQRGDVWVLRWRGISDRIKIGDLELV